MKSNVSRNERRKEREREREREGERERPRDPTDSTRIDLLELQCPFNHPSPESVTNIPHTKYALPTPMTHKWKFNRPSPILTNKL